MQTRLWWGGAYDGIWWSLRLAGVWSQAVGFVLVRLAGIWLQSPWRCFHIWFTSIKKFYKFCTYNAICKDNAAINCIIVQHKKGLFSSTLTLVYRITHQKSNTASNISANWLQWPSQRRGESLLLAFAHAETVKLIQSGRSSYSNE
jgi:hypothetical protein